jgi:hypothetical protein
MLRAERNCCIGAPIGHAMRSATRHELLNDSEAASDLNHLVRTVTDGQDVGSLPLSSFPAFPSSSPQYQLVSCSPYNSVYSRSPPPFSPSLPTSQLTRRLEGIPFPLFHLFSPFLALFFSALAHRQLRQVICAGPGSAALLGDVGVPTRLKDWIRGYPTWPAMLPEPSTRSRKLERLQPRREVHTVWVVSIRQNVYTRSRQECWASRPLSGVMDAPNVFSQTRDWERVALPTNLAPRYADGYIGYGS